MTGSISVTVTALASTEDDYTPTTRASINREDETSIFDETRIHGGVALLQSYQDFMIAPGMRERGGIRGFELSLGVDLFSQNWIAEGVVMSFPEASIADTTMSANAFELRMLYEKPIFYGVTVKGGVGLGSRSYNLKTKARVGTNIIDTDKSFSSGATVFVLGLEYWPSGEVSAGVEVSNHLPMASGDDPSSVDLGIKLSGHF